MRHVGCGPVDDRPVVGRGRSVQHDHRVLGEPPCEPGGRVPTPRGHRQGDDLQVHLRNQADDHVAREPGCGSRKGPRRFRGRDGWPGGRSTGTHALDALQWRKICHDTCRELAGCVRGHDEHEQDYYDYRLNDDHHGAGVLQERCIGPARGRGGHARSRQDHLHRIIEASGAERVPDATDRVHHARPMGLELAPQRAHVDVDDVVRDLAESPDRCGQRFPFDDDAGPAH